MKPGRFRRLLSYLTEIHVESCPSEVNPHLYVCLNRGRYQLATSKSVYSFSDLYSNYYLSFKHMEWDKVHPRTVLLLGLGLGSIPDMLTSKFQKDLEYTAVEIDPHVVYLAGKYVMDTLAAPVDVHVGDAWAYAMQCSRRFDMVCMDVFVDDEIPENMQTIDFLKRLQLLLTPSGVLLYNMLARTTEDVRATRSFLNEKFLRVFPDGGYLDVKGNWMLVNNRAYFRNY